MEKVKISWNWDLFSITPDNWEVYNRQGDKITFINHDPERSQTSKILYEHYSKEGDVMRRTVGYTGNYYGNSNGETNQYDLVYMIRIKNDRVTADAPKDDEEELTIQKRLMFAVFLNTENDMLSYHPLAGVKTPQSIENTIKRVVDDYPGKVHLATINLEDHPQVKAALKAQGLTRKKH